MTSKRCIVGLVFVLLFFFAVTGCRSGKGPPEFIYRKAVVTNISIRITESFLTQVSAVIEGTLPDACTVVDTITQEMQGTTFLLSLTSRRPVDDVCAQVITPFEAVVPLAVEGMRAGVYGVVANGVSSSFELETDNMVP